VSEARVVVTQTDDSRWRELDPAWFPRLAVIFDGRNSIGEFGARAGITYHGVGVGRHAAIR
jgi:hypothetical protein